MISIGQAVVVHRDPGLERLKWLARRRRGVEIG
jgi:hypothetical protein